MENSETSILVTGVGFGSLGRELIKSFKMASHKYKIIATDKLPHSIGLFETENRFVIPESSSDDYLDTLLKICKKENVQVLAPGSEPEIEKISKNMKIFEEIGVKTLLNPWNVIEKCIDKFDLMNFLKNKNLPHPKFFLHEHDSDVNKVESYPVIIKPRTGSGSRNVFIAQDEEELIFFTNYLKKYGFEPLVQEYIGDHEEEYTIGILYADNGKLHTSIAMKRILSAGLSTKQIG